MLGDPPWPQFSGQEDTWVAQGAPWLPQRAWLQRAWDIVWLAVTPATSCSGLAKTGCVPVFYQGHEASGSLWTPRSVREPTSKATPRPISVFSFGRDRVSFGPCRVKSRPPEKGVPKQIGRRGGCRADAGAAGAAGALRLHHLPLLGCRDLQSWALRRPSVRSVGPKGSGFVGWSMGTWRWRARRFGGKKEVTRIYGPFAWGSDP